MVSYASDIQTIERTFSVLRALAGRSDATGVTEVARTTGLAKSTCSRILAGLEDLGMVERVEEAGRYVIGAGLVALADVADLDGILRRERRGGGKCGRKSRSEEGLGWLHGQFSL